MFLRSLSRPVLNISMNGGDSTACLVNLFQYLDTFTVCLPLDMLPHILISIYDILFFVSLVPALCSPCSPIDGYTQKKFKFF